MGLPKLKSIFIGQRNQSSTDLNLIISIVIQKKGGNLNMPLQPGQVKVTTSETFDPLPMDKYTVQIQDVNAVDQFNQWKGVEETLLNYQFVVLDDKMMPATDKQGKPTEVTVRGRFIWMRIRPVVNTRSHLYKIAKAVLGRDPTKEEMDGFDPSSVIGKQVDVVTEQNVSKKDPNTVFTNIKSFGKTHKPLPPYEKQEVQTTSAPATPAKAPDIPTANDPDAYMDKLDKEMDEDAKEAPNPTPTPTAEAAESPAVKLAKAELALAKAEAEAAK